MRHSFSQFLRAGHAPTLFAAFFNFTFSCCIWVLNGAMAPFIGESFDLSPAQKGMMLRIVFSVHLLQHRTVRLSALIASQPRDKAAAILAGIERAAAKYQRNGQLDIPVAALLAVATRA